MNKKHNQFTLEITTTALCNMGCTYCFEGAKTNTQRLDDKVDVVKKRIYELLDSNFLKDNYEMLNLTFWGGEPTLNGNLIVDIMTEFQHLDKVNFHIYTNGYNRKRLDDILDKVDIRKLTVQISHDGKEIGDKFRVTHSGKPTSDQVVENIEYFARKGCTSGAHMHAIDVDGNSYACHGSIYSPNKDLMKGGNIMDDGFINSVESMSKKYQTPIKEVSDICKGCVATTCMICPVSSLDNSKKVDYFDRWTDRWVNNMCGFFKAFGEIDRSVQSYLNKEIKLVEKEV